MSSKLRVSDHALVKWIARTGTLEVELVREALRLSLQAAADAAATLQSSNFIILADGLVYHVRDNTLVTVLDDGGEHVRARVLRYRGGD